MLILTQWGMVFHAVAVYGFDSDFFPATFYEAVMMGQNTNVL